MRSYSGPFGSRLPALEQNILKRRAMEMTLILFHAEDLRRAIIDPVRTSGHLMSRLKGDPSLDILPKGTKDEFKKAARKLIKDGVISEEEAKEIRTLIDYRNVVAHDIQHLTLDLSNDRYVRETLPYRAKNEKRYDAKALERLKHFNRRSQKGLGVATRFRSICRLWSFGLLNGRSKQKSEGSIGKSNSKRSSAVSWSNSFEPSAH